mgnify:CR=1 FL=1
MGRSVPPISSSCICWSIGLSAPVRGHFTGEEALARWDEWAHKRPRDYQALIKPRRRGYDSRAAAPWRSRGACQLVSHG